MTEQPSAIIVSNEREAHERVKVSALSPRPPEITTAIDDNFEGLISGKEKGYLYTGMALYGFIAGIGTDDLINALRTESSEQKQILDVGTGDGMFLRLVSADYGAAVSMHGLSANDFRKPDMPLPSGIDYRIGNAEHILDLYRKDQFDLIVSARTVLHLIDPLGAIAQMYEILKPNGVLAIDDFTLTGIEDRLPDLINALQQSGYEIVANYEYTDNGDTAVSTEFSGLIIRKSASHPHLELPVVYNGLTEEGRAKYALARELPHEPKILPKATAEFIAAIRELHPWQYEGEVKDLEALAEMLRHNPDAIRMQKEEDDFISQILNRTGNDIASLGNVQNAWNEVIQEGKGWRKKKQDTIRKMEEMRERIPAAVGGWVVKYRNGRKMREDIREKLEL